MSRNPRNSDDLLGKVLELEKRLERLERGDREESEIYFTESDTTIAGESRKDGEGNIVLSTSRNEVGMLYPTGNLSFRDTNDSVVFAFASAQLDPTFVVEGRYLAHEVIYFTAKVSVPANSRCDISLYDEIDDSALGNTIDLNPGGIGRTYNITCEFIHPWSVGLGTEGANSGRETQFNMSLAIEVTDITGGSITVIHPSNIVTGSSAMFPDASSSTPLTFV